MIDPDIAGLLKAMRDSGFAAPEPFSASAFRQAFDTPLPGPPVEIALRRNLSVDGATGPLPARLYHPRPGETLPLTLFFHGGGWVHGTLDTHDRMAAAIAVKADCAVVAVDYRLAPEHPFPAAWEDAVAVFAWARANAADAGGDAQRIAVAGDSAGGNLSAAVAQAAAGDPALVHQLLLNPAVDMTRLEAAGAGGESDGFLSREQMLWYVDQYVPADSRRDPRASPGLATLPADVAPATIVVAGADPLYDEAVDYAAALREAGVAVTLLDYPGGIHGFVSLFGMIPLADEAMDAACAALKAALHPVLTAPA